MAKKYMLKLSADQLNGLESMNLEASEEDPETSGRLDKLIEHARKWPNRGMYEVFLETKEANWVKKLMWIFEVKTIPVLEVR